ncbi:GIN domain-containing protein [Algoriphagus resistens]|uniref:GIN domain-containing protein n=1 Tax=Algoriphagus resistens TaxID=1750590 RepID=UPI000716AF83|nr:DUF2807 domain-containing protein [Algoriphagus resistens]
MKKILNLAVFFASLVIAACNHDDENGPELPMEFTVDSYESVSVDGQLKVVFHRLEIPSQQSVSLKSDTASVRTTSSTSTGEFKVKIKSDPLQRRSLQVKSEGGVLFIIAENNIMLSDSITVELYSDELNEIRLESDQIAEFRGVFDQESLNVVTEARSKLGLYDFRVDYLTCKTEGESEVTLSTYTEGMGEDPSFEESTGVLINDQTLLVNNSIYVRGDSVRLEGELWIVYGNDVSSYFEMELCDLKTEGETIIDAIDAASRNVNIKLEGNSEARIWATESITGKGEGASKLYYINVTGLDNSGFVMEGSAQIIALE